MIEAPSTKVTTTKEELVDFFKQMYKMRRVEITNDTEYKVRNPNEIHCIPLISIFVVNVGTNNSRILSFIRWSGGSSIRFAFYLQRSLFVANRD